MRVKVFDALAVLEYDILLAIGPDAGLPGDHVKEERAGNLSPHIFRAQAEPLLAEDGVDALNIPLPDVA